MDVIKINDLCFKYKDKVIFDKFNLNIKDNTFVTLLGPNGSGKSTLIRILVGLLPYDGYINIAGLYLNKENLKKIRLSIGYVSDNIDNQFIGETVLDNLVYNLENLCYPKEEIKINLDRIVDKFELKDIIEMEPNNLTNSKKQLVNIAAALIHKPKILIIDEGLHQLNIEDKKLVFDILLEYKKKHKMTIILITHNTEETILSDRVIILNKGNIELDDDVIGVYNNEKLLKKIGINIPFIIQLSNYLIFYNLIDKTYLNMEELVNDLWM